MASFIISLFVHKQELFSSVHKGCCGGGWVFFLPRSINCRIGVLPPTFCSISYLSVCSVAIRALTSTPSPPNPFQHWRLITSPTRAVASASYLTRKTSTTQRQVRAQSRATCVSSPLVESIGYYCSMIALEICFRILECFNFLLCNSFSTIFEF